MDRIRILREKKKITQVRLSIEAGVAQETISAYENGRAEPSNEKLIRIANFLNTTTDYLLERTDKDSPLKDLTEEFIDDELCSLIENYTKLTTDQKKELIWYSKALQDKNS